MTDMIKDLLEECQVVAVVGLSADEEKASHRVARYMQECGYRIIPVNPKESSILGEKAYPSLRDIPGKVDIVDIFRRAEDVPPLAEDAVAIGAKALWLQQGIVNQQAADTAEKAGLKVVMDRCIMTEHIRCKSL
jgi:predicted CoA-binding protein